MTSTLEAVDLVAPAFRVVPARVGTYVDEVVDFGRAIGHEPDPEQADDLDAHCSFGPGGLPVAGESWELEGRQNGKTDRVILLWTMFDFWVGPRGRLVDWTSHLMDTTRKTSRIVEALVDANPLLSRRVKSVSHARGSEGIVLHRLPGEDAEREWRWTTRSVGAGRGGSADVWVADEAMFLTPAMMGARRPTLRSRSAGQLRAASSAGLASSRVLAAAVERGRAGDDGIVYVERCAPGGFDGSLCELGQDCSHVYGSAEGCAMDREELYVRANHALARGRIALAKLRDERRASTTVELAREFGREAMGWHEDVAADEETVEPAMWDRFEDRSSRVDPAARPDVLVVAVRPNAAGSVVALAGPREDGRLHLALIRRDEVDGELLVGERLIAEVLKLRKDHRVRRVVVVAGPSSRPIADALRIRLRAVLTVTRPEQQAAAVSSLLAGIREDDFRHRGDRIVRASLEAARPRRTSDGGWAIDTRSGDGEALPFLVVVLARWAARQRGGRR